MANTRGPSPSVESYSRSHRPPAAAFPNKEGAPKASVPSSSSPFLRSRYTGIRPTNTGSLASSRKRNVDELYEDEISEIYADSDVSTGRSEANISGTAAPTLPRRVASIVPAQKRINWSLLQGSNDTRIPGYLIVELYREALENRALQQKVQQRQNMLAESNPTLPVSETLSRPTASPCSASNVIAHTSLSVPRVRETTPQMLKRGSLRSKNSAGVSKAKLRSKPIKSRIQLVPKPLIDITQLPEERKKAPGFYTANFEVSDSESDDEPEPELTASSNAKPDSELVRRPQVLSAKLKNQAINPTPTENSAEPFASESLTRNDKPNLLSNDPPKFSFGAKETSSEQKATAEKPKFSFNSDTSAPSEKPAFSFGGLAPKPTEKSEQPTQELPGKLAEKPAADSAKKPIFSFGASSTDSAEPAPEKAAKPAFSFGDLAKKPEDKPKFSFGAANGPAESAADSPVDSTASKPANDKPAFSFGAKPAASDPAPPAAKRPLFGSSTSDAKPALFGAAASGSNENSQPEFPKKPAFTFGAISSAANTNKNTADSVDAGTSTTTTEQPPAKPAFLFGSSTNEQTTTSSKTPAANSGGSEPSTAAPATPKFVFGASSSAAADAPKPAFTFGAAANATAEKPALFGAAAPDKQSSTPSFSFGAPATASSSTPFSFGKPAAAGDSGTKPTDPAPAKTSTPFQFSASTSSTAPPKPAFDLSQSAAKVGAFKPADFTKPAETQPAAPKFTFGAPASTSTAGTSGPQPAAGSSLFGTNSSTSTAATNGAAAPLFGAANGTSTPNSGTPAPTTATGSTPFTFGAPAAPPANSGSGADSASATNGAATPFAFGQSSKQTTPFSFQPGGTTPAIGQPAPAFGGFGAPAAPGGSAFGQPVSGTTPFGSKASTPQAGFSFGAPAGAPSTSAFGAPAAPSAFGAAPEASSAFGTSAPGAGSAFGAASGASNAFGTANTSNTSTFGSRESTPGLPGAAPAGIPGRKMARVKRLLRK